MKSGIVKEGQRFSEQIHNRADVQRKNYLLHKLQKSVGHTPHVIYLCH